MQRRYSILITVVLMAMVPSVFSWAGDSAKKIASGELGKGYQAAKRGYWNEAMARYQNASKNVPGSAEIWNNLGVALEAVGQYAEAGDAYRRALELDPSNGKIHKNYNLYNDFYMAYILKPEADEEIESSGEQPPIESDDADGEDATEDNESERTEEGADDVSHS